MTRRLRWELEWGRFTELFEAWAAEGDEVRALKMRPELRGLAMAVWPCFWSLHRERFGEMGASPIRAESVAAWCDLHGVRSTEHRAIYYALIQRLDDAWLEHKAEKEADKED